MHIYATLHHYHTSASTHLAACDDYDYIILYVMYMFVTNGRSTTDAVRGARPQNHRASIAQCNIKQGTLCTKKKAKSLEVFHCTNTNLVQSQ